MTATALLLATLALGLQGGVPDGAFQRGAEAYGRAEFELATAAWEESLRAGAPSAAVYYNLGNAYWKRADLGRAVLNWERARRLDPRDHDVIENLEFARRLLVDEVPDAQSSLGRAATRIASAVTLGEAAAAAVGLWWALGLATFGAILLDAGKRRLALGAALVTALGLVALLPILSWHLGALGDSNRAVVLADSVDVRSGPGERYTSVFTVHEGLVVAIQQTTSGWHQLRLPNGLGGWVSAEAVEGL